MSLESSIADLVRASTDLTQTVRGKTTEIDGKVTAKINEMDAWKAGHIDEHGFLAINYNAGMTRLSGTVPQQLPLGMGVSAGGDFWSKFDVDIIPVRSGDLPESRPAVVRELLKYMGMDRQHFSANFNIIELTVKRIDISSFVFFIPYRHVKMGSFHSVVMYHKIIGQGDWTWMDNSVKGKWNQMTSHHASADSAGAYVHVDVVLERPAIGDKLYLALPQIVIGKWNPLRRAPQFFNVYDMILDAVPTAIPRDYM
ncbi:MULTISPECIES: hypothetical protein [Chromobacterium]|uniref:hypothetical protein n=1 Tax=Chromobacterium TaxID=535 RepID=UPI00188966D7|nr:MULTISPECIES: hypothetical protein [Chromobacterium]QOZ83189.1 hypothetical protein DXT74_09010 [Chromobacterium sp. Rain0013]WON83289.1 hypothetical protein OK026_19470 [Chromobacterium haemolyticum]